MPWGNKGQRSQNFVDHINIRHKFEYDYFVVSADDVEYLPFVAFSDFLCGNFGRNEHIVINI